MTKLNTMVNLAAHDKIYQSLIDMHAGRSDAESQRINARLIFLLINHIGNEQVIIEAIGRAKGQSGF